jgi:hypothetical protein
LLRTGGAFYVAVKAGAGDLWETEAWGVANPRYFSFWHPDQLDAALVDAGLQIVRSAQEPGDLSPWLVRLCRRAASN